VGRLLVRFALLVLLFAVIAAPTAPETIPAPAPDLPVAVEPAPVEPAWVPLRIVVTGDINLNRNLVAVRPDGSDVWGTIVPFDSFFQGIQGRINGDINFGNIETIITDRNDFKEKKKAYCFRMHPNGMRTILGEGFNLFSMANNHSYDYGAEGVRETLKHIAALEKEADFNWTGLGLNKEQAIRPAIFTVKGIKVGFTALGIGQAAGNNSPGVAQEYYYREALSLLRDADVDLRIMSCHDGKEGRSVPIDRQLRVYREAIRDYDVNIVVGHHPHVVQGIEHYDGGLIFYSLGNFMIRGAADMSKKPGNIPTRDFGLLAQIDLKVKPGGKNRLDRLEILPVYDMHQGPHPLNDMEQAHERVDVVNDLSSLSQINSVRSGSIPSSTAKNPIVFEKKDGVGFVEFQDN
jgi:poly-gamma-glutamate capsule biosynthesis protein CapA/YwtB (metallophosphatase superfamily)